MKRKNALMFAISLLVVACTPQKATESQESHSLKKDVTQSQSLKQSGEVTIYTTAENSALRLTLTGKKSLTPAINYKEAEVTILVNPTKTFQTFLGIGGAITDASAETFAKLPANKQQEFLTACYDQEKGIGYSLARTNIHSCDFSSDSYSYIAEGDKDLKTFNIDHDRQFKLPLIKKSIEAAGGKLRLFASPWTPPAFMKDNNDMLHGGTLLPNYYQTWALYFTKFIKAYEAENIPIWGVTIQNEPAAKQPWESCIYTAEQERDFLKNFLGPIMKQEGFGDKKIIVWDHNRDLMTERANVIFEDTAVSKYAWGIGTHWYETWGGRKPMYDNVRSVHESFPEKNILLTEACIDKFKSSEYQNYSYGEQFGSAMINDFNNGTVGWTFWNVLLDEKGGPNHVGNYCFSPIHGDTKTGELIYTPTYYYIGHFSKYIRPNAKRVSASTTNSNVLTTAFLNEDGKLVIIIMNETDKIGNYRLILGSQTLENTIPAHAIQTLLY